MSSVLRIVINYKMICNFDELRIHWKKSLSLLARAVLSCRYKRQTIKRSFPSTTLDDSRGSLSLSLSFYLFRLSSRIVRFLDVLPCSPRLAQAWYVHRRFYSINWNCNSPRKVGGFSNTAPDMCARAYTGWPKNEGVPRPHFDGKIDDFLFIASHRLPVVIATVPTIVSLVTS